MLAEGNQVFKALDMTDILGRIKPSKMDKYKQVDEFLRLINQTLDSQLLPKDEINVVDLGCGHAYLTFAVQEFLTDKYSKVLILGVDERQDSKQHNEKVAAKLKVDAKFIAAKIADTPDQKVDIAIALHACDTATDDAIYWAVKNDAKVIMAAPCCMHELQTQIKDSPEPWELLTKYGLVKERLVDLITDSLRAQILKLLGFRVDIVEFIGGEHTARNILIRAVKTGAVPTDLDKQRYQQMINDWQIKPYLAQLLADELKAAAQISRP
jgi:SAM-dependent methyltransferase